MILEVILIGNVLHSVMWYDHNELGFTHNKKGGSNMKSEETRDETVSNELELEIEEMDQIIAPGTLLSD